MSYSFLINWPGRAMKRTIEDAVLAGESRLLEALSAYRAFKDADEGGAPENEVRRLWILAESLYHTVNDFQLLVAGPPPSTVH